MNTDISDTNTPDDRPLAFLTLQDALVLRHGLRGIHEVDVRLIGPHPSAGVEVVAFLNAEGMATTFRQLERMIPPPARRFVFRYSGGRAEVTISPDIVE